MSDYDFGYDDTAMLRKFKEMSARWDEVSDRTDKRLKELESSRTSDFFNSDTIVGEVKTKPVIDPMDFDKQEMKKRELQRLEKELSKAEHKLERLTGKTSAPAEKPDWVEQEDAINMVVRAVWFGWYSAWVTSIGNEAKRGVKFYARNPYNAYLMARRWATKGGGGYFLSSNIRFENM